MFCSVPSRPTILTVAPTTHSQLGFGLFVSWKAPQSDCDITSYKVQYKISSDTSWSTPLGSVRPPLRRYDLRGLSPKTNYNVQVRAVSKAGNGEWSDVRQATTLGGMYILVYNFSEYCKFPFLNIFQAPGPVRSLSATPILVEDMPAISVKWSPPVDKAGGGLTYRLKVVPSHVTISSGLKATKYNVTGLRVNIRYTVYISAVSAGLYGPEVPTYATTVGSECCIND